MNTELHKQWLNLTLADNFLFQKYMQNVENCKKLISEICGREVERIEYKNTEQSIEEGKYMNYAEIIRDAKKEGIREGREYGTRMTKIKVIKMLLEKMDIEEIIEIGFDEALVKEVAENQNA